VPTTGNLGATAPASATRAATATATPRPPTSIPPPAYTNLSGNGGFESGSLSSPWGTGIYEPRSQVFWGQADADATVVGDSVHGGSFALRITNRSQVKPQVYRTLSQKVAVKGGIQHCLTWWARTANGTSGLVTFRLNDAWTQVFSIGAGQAAWTQYAGTFVPEDSNIDLRIVSENTGTAWLDDIELSEGACTVGNGVVAAGTNPRAPR
jgi:hypothetical protein